MLCSWFFHIQITLLFFSGHLNFYLMQSGLLKRIKGKEDERDSFELQISDVDLSHIDEREQSMVT